MKFVKAPGFAAYALIVLWFLLTVLTPMRASAADTAQTLRVADVAPTLEAALMAEGMPADAQLVFADPDAVLFLAPGDALTVDHVSYNPATGRFLLRVATAAGSMSVAGAARAIERFPVLIGDVARGETIGAENLSWIESADYRAADYVLDAGELSGMEARRALAAGEPVRKIDVAAPVLVKRGAAVLMIYEADGLTLTHSGVAKATGARGDVIEVENLKSERSLKAVVVGENTVAVSPVRTAYLERR